jgi:hypothetical protein
MVEHLVERAAVVEDARQHVDGEAAGGEAGLVAGRTSLGSAARLAAAGPRATALV